MADRYTYKWRGKDTGWDYKLVISPAAAIIDGDVNLEPAAMGRISFSYGWDTFQIGAASSPELKVEFRLDRIPPELYDALVTPFKKYSYSFNSAILPSGIPIPLKFTAGNNYRLYIKFNGNDDNATPAYQLVYNGVQKIGMKFTVKGNIHEVTVTGISRAVLENIPIDTLRLLYENTADRVKEARLYDIYPRNLDFNQRFGFVSRPSSGTVNYWLYSLGKITDWIESIANEIYKILWNASINDTAWAPAATDFYIDLPIPDYYKNSYDGSGTKGLLENNPNLLFLPCFAAEDGAISPLSDFGFLGGDLSGDYGTVWDLLSDWYLGTARKAYPVHNYQNVTNYKIKYTANKLFYSDDLIVLSLNDFSNDLEFQMFGDILQRSIVARTDAIDDDITEIEHINPSSRTEETITLPMILNNIPAQLQEAGLTYNDTMKYSEYLNSNFAKVCYKDDASGYYYRVHEHCRYDFFDNIDSDDYNTFVPVLQDDAIAIKAAPLQIQKTSGAANILAKSILNIFSSESQCKIISKLPISKMINVRAGNINEITNPFFEPISYGFKFDPDELALIAGKYERFRTPGLDYAKWFIISCSVDLSGDEICDVELINKPV